MEGTETSATTRTSNHRNSDVVPCNLGDVVLVKGEKIIGVVSYKGIVDWDTSNTIYIGLTLSDPVPNGHNGSIQGRSYFECTAGHGLIISSYLISRKITGRELLQKVTALNNAYKECYHTAQDVQRKYIEIRETLHRVEGENQSLRHRLQYYERNNNPYITHTSQHSPTPNSRTLSPSPSPNTRTRSKSTANHSHNHNHRTFQKALPPLPNNNTKFKPMAKSMPPSPHMTPMVENEHEILSYGLPTPSVKMNKHKRGRHKKKGKRVYRKRSNSNDSYRSQSRTRSHKSSYKSFKSRKSSYKSRNGNTSFRPRRSRGHSDVSRSTMTTQNTADRLVTDSPMPLSIGDHTGGTIKMLLPNSIHKLQRSYSTNTLDILNDHHEHNDESESHDFHDTNSHYTRTNTSHFDDRDIVDESENELLSPINTNNTQVSFDTDRHTNTPKSTGSGNYGQRFISKFLPRDMEDIDDDDVLSAVLYNEESDLELGSVGASMNNIHERDSNMIFTEDMNIPPIINEESEKYNSNNDDMDMMDNKKHLTPHIVEEDDDMMMSSENDMINQHNHDISESESIEFEQGYQQVNEDSNLEIESPQVVSNVKRNNNNIGVHMYKQANKHNLSIIAPQSQSHSQSNATKPIQNTHEKKPLPPLLNKQRVNNASITTNNANMKAAHSIQYSGSIMSNDVSLPDNIGLYTEQGDNMSALLSETQSSARYSNTPSYTLTNGTAMTNNTFSPQKRNKDRKRLSHTLAPIRLPQKFNPGKKFSSVPAHFHNRTTNENVNTRNDHDHDVSAAQDVLANMNNTSDDNSQSPNTQYTQSSNTQSPNSNRHFRISPPQNIHINMYGQNDNGILHNISKRKSMGSSLSLSKNKKKPRKKRIIRSRTFVSTTNGQKYDCLETAKQLDASTLTHQRQTTPEINSVEEKSHTPILSPLPAPKSVPLHAPQSVPLHALQEPTTSHQMTLDDFELDHQLDNYTANIQHNNRNSRNSRNIPHTPSHIHAYSQHVNVQRKSIPVLTPTIVNAQSEYVHKKDFYRKKRNKKNKGNLRHINTHSAHGGLDLNSPPYTMNTMRKSQSVTKKSNDILSQSPHRNLGSLTHNELKGLLEADNLFSYDNYQKMVQ